MNSYLDLLDTDHKIQMQLTLESASGHAHVIINGQSIYHGAVVGSVDIVHTIPLLEPIVLCVTHDNVYLSSLIIDGWQARPQYAWEVNGVFTLETKLPFYQWHHQVSGQGWLLRPY